MFTPEELAAYLAVVVLLVAVPGPNTALIVAQSLAGGRRAGLATVAGVELGTLVHVVAAALGLSAAVARSAFLFDLVRALGAGALLWLGARELLRRDEVDDDARHAAPAGEGRAFRRAFVGNVLNPKVAIFFLAFLPQWVDPARGAVLAQLAILGSILVAVGASSGLVLALAAGALGRRVAGRPGFERWRRRLTGSVLVALGLGLAAQEMR